MPYEPLPASVLFALVLAVVVLMVTGRVAGALLAADSKAQPVGTLEAQLSRGNCELGLTNEGIASDECVGEVAKVKRRTELTQGL